MTSRHLLLVLEIGLGARVLDSLFDDLFDLIPVASIDAVDLAAEMLLNLTQHVPFFPVGDERDGNTNATKTTSTSDTVEVGLIIGLTRATTTLLEVLRDILL